MPPLPKGGKKLTILVNFRGIYQFIYIPQSKIRDFCQPPLGKGAFIGNLKQLDKLGFIELLQIPVILSVSEESPEMLQCLGDPSTPFGRSG